VSRIYRKKDNKFDRDSRQRTIDEATKKKRSDYPAAHFKENRKHRFNPAIQYSAVAAAGQVVEKQASFGVVLDAYHQWYLAVHSATLTQFADLQIGFDGMDS